MDIENKIGSLNIKWAKMWESGVLNSWSQRYEVRTRYSQV